VVADTVEGLRRQVSQTIELRFARPVPPGVFESLEGVQRVTAEGNRITLQTSGRLAGLLRVIADHDPLDVVARHADLDELFLGYYRADGVTGDG
jgi:ABC-2 type transport system ATP-binding protein